eukprot:4519793-Alexandrium_andersonii.AAC.1
MSCPSQPFTASCSRLASGGGAPGGRSPPRAQESARKPVLYIGHCTLVAGRHAGVQATTDG